MTTAPAFPACTILGYPRIGRNRELKKAVEAHWRGATTVDELEARAAELRAGTRERLAALGLGRDDSSIPESFSYYDQVLDAAVAVGALPSRFADLADAEGLVDLESLFTLARGDAARGPLEMTKWFDTNYHYLVPEIGAATAFRLASRRIVEQFEEAKAAGFVTRPSIVGPVTLLLLAKPEEGAPAGFAPIDRLEALLPVYVQLLAELARAGAVWVQLDESALASESLGVPRERVLDAVRTAYAALADAGERPALFVATAYGSIGDGLQPLLDAGVEAIGLDLVHGAVPSADVDFGATVLAAGVIDGRNIWRGDLRGALGLLEAQRETGRSVAVSTATSLQHAPHSLEDETALDARLVSWLAFADEKVGQVAVLARGLAEGPAAVDGELVAADAALADRAAAPGVRDGGVREREAALQPGDDDRAPYAVRRLAQEALTLPALPTTTIGSFPQTPELRSLRARNARGDLPEADYIAAVREEIRSVVELQERIGLDVLVHGEPERNDMVQYFAEHLDGFAVTRNGWVQSYGSRATKPSILWGDVSRPAPITVEWSSFAQGLTEKPVKGMLTGPVTILAWSFVRDDQPLGVTARQVAFALRDEIADLETAGITIVQVDEPALRELLPLKLADQQGYLDWSVGSFRLATGAAAAGTQVHTHLCYSEFGAVIDAIRDLDADVTSIEAARSRLEVVDDITASGFDHGVGPGVWDIHSPRVPSVDEIVEGLQRAVDAIGERTLWVNPDCGLKTRGYEETTASLESLVAAASIVRERLAAR